MDNEAARRRLLVGLCWLTTLFAVFALTQGSVVIPVSEVVRIVGAGIGVGSLPQDGSANATIITELRTPRVLLALLIGAALAQSGAAMQGIFRNPLADPGLVGVASGASLAAVANLVLGATLWPQWNTQFSGLSTPLAAFAGGGLAAWLALKLAQRDGHTQVATLLLAGLALNAIAGAGIGLLSQIASDSGLRIATHWLFGSLGKAGWIELKLAAPLLLTTLVLINRQARHLDALLLGEAEAGHLGIPVERLKRRSLTLIVLAVASCVALAGVVGFIGLIVPHLIRLIAGPGHRLLLPASALGGAALLCVADLFARTLMAPVELPVGILTALVGGPFFLALLVKYRGRMETW